MDNVEHEDTNAVWGVSCAIDIYDCSPETIRDPEAIRRFAVELCELIGMVPFGEPLVVHFGKEERIAGFSLVQLLETSLISAHFANWSNAVYLDVFSCRPYEKDAVADFARRYFGGSRVSSTVALRY
jgi:S-adenosylmethionine/arginine decarboxylase-like enzyme